IPDAAISPSNKSVYKAIFDSSQSSRDPSQLIPALNMAGSELNALAAAGVPVANARFVVVFHGSSVDGLLQDDAYRAKFGVGNPNLPVLSKLKDLGVELFVCGQFLAAAGPDPAILSPDVTVASDALIVLMTYQNQGYALLNF
ncbi:MAG: DsrE family protein, partial [Lysobacterales bacterium]